jgi:nucleotide-binding universal stress UspA family protein
VGPVHERQTRASELKREKKELEKLAKKLEELGVEASPLLIQGATAELILIETQHLEAGLLVMVTHGHGFAMTALLGSTSHQVMKDVSCPVLLISHKKIRQ